jgi:hypothetical protein
MSTSTTTFLGAPRVLRAGLVLADATTLVVQRVIAMQYNPDTLSRSLQARAVANEGGDRLEALRLTGPPIETWKLDAEIDATDQLEQADQNPLAVQLGIQPQLAALEMLVYPPSAQIVNEDNLAQAGTIEIAPVEAPLTLFVWSAVRIVPVRVTEFSITEEAFDVNLNPIRAKVSLGMRVLNVNDFQFDDKGNNVFMAYHQQKERLASLAGVGSLASLGINSIGG